MASLNLENVSLADRRREARSLWRPQVSEPPRSLRPRRSLAPLWTPFPRVNRQSLSEQGSRLRLCLWHWGQPMCEGR